MKLKYFILPKNIYKLFEVIKRSTSRMLYCYTPIAFSYCIFEIDMNTEYIRIPQDTACP